jgi:hypothetical protein
MLESNHLKPDGNGKNAYTKDTGCIGDFRGINGAWKT